ncbi:Methyl-CpG-binding domain-containing protein 13 [Quillaja saponaria]|uniref:Methyl-CpG-binding domain-containing protein 13 n=1 Tax=Quillaja saponaria TaxID=32244 RepID=A0AAD7M4Y8_QUISA|nr:Methyl-CpG-binding domain-containing protein 13 [Quillaja saponaria]
MNYYISPSCGLRFNSRAEVSRYLSKQANKGSYKRKSNNVLVEEGIAEGLPTGWIKNVRVTKKGGTVRRDTFYTDPISGYVFRSMKDTLRYLETGELGRLTLKPKEKLDSSDVELDDDKFSSPGAAKKPKFTVSRARRQIFLGQSSNMDETVNDKLILESTCAREFGVGTELSGSLLPKVEELEQIEGKADYTKSEMVSVTAVGASLDEKLPESAPRSHESEKAQHRQCKFKPKKETNLPCRASRRLAGLEVDLVPELKTSNRACRASVKQSGEGVPVTDNDSSHDRLSHRASRQLDVLGGKSETKSTFDSSQSSVGSTRSSMGKNSCTNLASPVKLAGKLIEETKSDKDQVCISVSPLENQDNLLEHVRNVANEEKSDEKPYYSLDLPLGELLTDPCIAFAIQTLTGMSFETSKNSLVSSESSDSKHSGNLADAKEHGKKIKGKNKVDEKQGCNAFLPPESCLCITQENAGKVEIDEKTHENSGSSLKLPFGALWMDPCIEFAIKTLTDAIPVDYDPNIQNCFQQQLSSLETQGNSELTLSSVGLDNFSQSEFPCHQYCAVEKPVFQYQPFVEQALPHSRNVSLHSSGGSRLPQTGEHLNNECQR